MKKQHLQRILDKYDGKLAFELRGYGHLYSNFIEIISQREYSLRDLKGIRSSTVTKILQDLFEDRDPVKIKELISISCP